MTEKKTLGVRCLQVGSETKKADYFGARELSTIEENENASESKKAELRVREG